MAISLRSILIFSSHLRQGLPKDLFPVGLPVKILKALLLSSILAAWPAHLSLKKLNVFADLYVCERYGVLSKS